ncbi:MAG TPA: hypothetical protein VGO91_10440 [Pyrinomonadaceae bacterium]|nr:hypothetical protein [Pyrinomonadaceae bacterium]
MSFCSMGEAQSGRRVKRPDANVSPAPAIEPAPAPQSPKESQPAPPKQKLIAGMDELGRSINIPQYMAGAVWDGFLDEFRKFSSLRVTTENMRRRDAIERAKKETESYVVLLQVETENLNSGGGVGQVNSNDLLVSYIIFSPVTGKIKSSGRVYVRSSRSILGGRLPTGRVADSQLYQAGRETADRVISALNLGSTVLSLLTIE